jgi:hypothetical protein
MFNVVLVTGREAGQEGKGRLAEVVGLSFLSPRGLFTGRKGKCDHRSSFPKSFI